jgi:hypothetical protein
MSLEFSIIHGTEECKVNNGSCHNVLQLYCPKGCLFHCVCLFVTSLLIISYVYEGPLIKQFKSCHWRPGGSSEGTDLTTCLVGFHVVTTSGALVR